MWIGFEPVMGLDLSIRCIQETVQDIIHGPLLHGPLLQVLGLNIIQHCGRTVGQISVSLPQGRSEQSRYVPLSMFDESNPNSPSFAESKSFALDTSPDIEARPVA